MAYRVELAARAERDLSRLYRDLNARNSGQGRAWLKGLEAAVLSLADNPSRCALAPEGRNLRHVLHSSRSYVYRIIYAMNETKLIVTVVHIRHGSRARAKGLGLPRSAGTRVKSRKRRRGTGE